MSIITLTTDYGLKDHFVEVGKYYLSILKLPLDISHHIDPFNMEASYIIMRYSSFPKGRHLIGVDMELNKENQHIVMQWNDSFLLLPITAFLAYAAKNCSKEYNIHDRLSSEATGLDVLFWWPVISPGRITKCHW
jgi:S-adenosylmethionine hydrolase